MRAPEGTLVLYSCDRLDGTPEHFVSISTIRGLTQDDVPS